MKTKELFICEECVKDRLAPAQLAFEKVKDTGNICRCDFCGLRTYCEEYRIQYGRTDRHASVSAGSR